ncbi:hypothetical protein IAR50_000221 [Cryptococcus sp. DSM 104548]
MNQDNQQDDTSVSESTTLLDDEGCDTPTSRHFWGGPMSQDEALSPPSVTAETWQYSGPMTAAPSELLNDPLPLYAQTLSPTDSSPFGSSPSTAPGDSATSRGESGYQRTIVGSRLPMEGAWLLPLTLSGVRTRRRGWVRRKEGGLQGLSTRMRASLLLENIHDAAPPTEKQRRNG